MKMQVNKQIVVNGAGHYVRNAQRRKNTPNKWFPIHGFIEKKEENKQAECIINSILSSSIQANEISYF